MSGYIGNIPVPQATQTRQSFTATASQTTFATLGYTPNFVDVYMNGVHLLDGTDYTATNGSDIVLTTGAAAGDVIEVVAYSTFQVSDQNFTGTTTVDTLNITGASTGTDLTLSGGVYLGGTGAANKLQDYEEGTWTPTMGASAGTSPTFGSSGGFYTKIGNVVYFDFDVIDITAGSDSSAYITITGLPFTVDTTNVRFTVFTDNITYRAGRTQCTGTANAGDFLYFFASGSGVADTAIDNEDIAAGTSDIFGTGFYYTDQ